MAWTPMMTASSQAAQDKNSLPRTYSHIGHQRPRGRTPVCCIYLSTKKHKVQAGSYMLPAVCDFTVYMAERHGVP